MERNGATLCVYSENTEIERIAKGSKKGKIPFIERKKKILMQS
jgi:hypothetical protein